MGSDKLEKLNFCDNCILGKYHRVASKKEEEGKQRRVSFEVVCIILVDFLSIFT